MFSGYSAWFAPELATYKATWRNHGGEERELAEADIAFVSDRTPSDPDSIKPTMKILRPDWIEDSVNGRKRLSLIRYRRTFPALQRWNSSPGGDKLAIGIDAYRSTNVKLIAAPSSSLPSGPLPQPEAEIQELSVTENSGVSEAANAMGSLVGEYQSDATQQDLSIALDFVDPRAMNSTMESTQTLSVLIGESELQNNIPDGSGTEATSGLGTEQELASAAETGADADTTNATMAIDVQSSSATASSSKAVATSKKRPLPESIKRTKRSPPAVRDSQADGDFFGDSESEEKSLDSQAHIHVQARNMDHHISAENVPSSWKSSARRLSQEPSQAAAAYLKDILGRMNEVKNAVSKKGLSQMEVVDISSTDIILRPKERDTGGK